MRISLKMKCFNLMILFCVILYQVSMDVFHGELYTVVMPKIQWYHLKHLMLVTVFIFNLR